MGRDRYDGFDSLVGDHAPGLLRTAVLLTGGRESGGELLLTALARARGRWPALRASGDPVAGVRQLLVDAALGRRRLGAEQVVEGLADGGAAGPRTAELREALLRLDPPVRAALVLRHHDDLAVEEVARLVRRPVATVEDDVDAATAALPVSGGGGSGDVREQLRLLAGELTWLDPSVAPAAVTARHRGERRTRVRRAAAGALVVAAVAAGVPAVAGYLGPPPGAAAASVADERAAARRDAAAEEARRAAQPRLEAAVSELGAPLVLTSPTEWDQWLAEGRPAQGTTGQEDEGTCPPLTERLTADLGMPMEYWTGALPRGPVGCTWVPGPVPLSQGGPYDYAQVVSVGFVGDPDGTAVERLRTVLLPDAARREHPCLGAGLSSGGALIGCSDPTGSYETPLVLAVPDARGAGVWVLSATVAWGADRSAAEVLSVLVEAVRPVYG